MILSFCAKEESNDAPIALGSLGKQRMLITTFVILIIFNWGFSFCRASSNKESLAYVKLRSTSLLEGWRCFFMLAFFDIGWNLKTGNSAWSNWWWYFCAIWSDVRSDDVEAELEHDCAGSEHISLTEKLHAAATTTAIWPQGSHWLLTNLGWATVVGLGNTEKFCSTFLSLHVTVLN